MSGGNSYVELPTIQACDQRSDVAAGGRLLLNGPGSLRDTNLGDTVRIRSFNEICKMQMQTCTCVRRKVQNRLVVRWGGSACGGIRKDRPSDHDGSRRRQAGS